MSMASARVPAAIATGLLGLVVGVGGGMGAMMAYGYHWDREPEHYRTDSMMGKAGGGGGPPAGGPPAGGQGQGKGKGGGGGGGGGPGFGGPGGGGGPQSKPQLAQLVAKLDLLTNKPLTITLTAEQKKKIREQLKDLADKKELEEPDAKERLDALLAILKDNKETLEAVGYRWPGEGGRGGGFGGPGGGGPGGGRQNPNPFKDEPNAKHLKSLETTVGKE